MIKSDITQTEKYIQDYSGAQFSDLQLQYMNAPRLLSILKVARARRSAIYYHWGWRCCEICHEYTGTQEEWDQEIRPALVAMNAFINRLKAVLSLKPHVPRRSEKRKKK